MKKLLTLLLLSCQAVFGTVVFQQAINGTFDETSYDTGNYRMSGDYFALHWVCMYPQFTNHIWSVSRSGADWVNQRQNQQPQFALPLWISWNALTASNYNWMLVSDNGGYNTTNPIIEQGLALASAPPSFWDGTQDVDYTGLVTVSIQHRFLGGIPNDSADGDEGALNRDLACIQLAQQLGLPPISGLWNPLMDNGWREDLLRSADTRLLGFYAGGHPYAAGHLAMAINELRELDAETNVGSIKLDWKSSTAWTQHASVSGVSMSNNVLACTIQWERIPPPYDWPNGILTNNCLPAFEAMPDLANAYRWMLCVTNLPDGDYITRLDGEFIDKYTAEQLRAGCNWWTNFNGPLGRQRMKLLDDKRDQQGADHVTLLDAHGAGDQGLNGWEDGIRLQSQCLGAWQAGLRGMDLYNAVKNTIASCYQFDVRMHDDAQQVPHTLTIERVALGPPKHLRIRK